jgi:hypothetical protein
VLAAKFPELQVAANRFAPDEALVQPVTATKAPVNELIPPVGAEAISALSLYVSAVAAAIVDAFVTASVNEAAAPTVGDVGAVTLIEEIDAVVAASPAPACAGTTDKSPNPSEATATADTFFNEIVFTIFLSFSQIKDDLLSGW